jgi:hypothetical protein
MFNSLQFASYMGHEYLWVERFRIQELPRIVRYVPYILHYSVCHLLGQHSRDSDRAV